MTLPPNAAEAIERIGTARGDLQLARDAAVPSNPIVGHLVNACLNLAAAIEFGLTPRIDVHPAPRAAAGSCRSLDIPMGHSIDHYQVAFHHNPNREGNALAQFEEGLNAIVERETADLRAENKRMREALHKILDFNTGI